MAQKKIYKFFVSKIVGLSIVLFLGINLPITAQNSGCNGVRYLLDIFPDLTTTTVEFGVANTMANVRQVLSMDIFQPSGDTLTKRPLIIWVFGGAFVTGSRLTMHEVCRSYAKRGYVTAAIDYRIFPPTLGLMDSVRLTTISIQAMHDLKAAIRYMRKNANLYKIDTSNIIAGGVSAGAITSLLAGHLDSTDNIPTGIRALITQEGGMEGRSGNAGFSSKIKAVINLSGSMPTTNWLDAGDLPTISYHGTNDNVVPYDCSVGLFNFSSCGSAAIHQRLTALRVPNMFYSVPGGGHDDIYNTWGSFASHLNAFSLRATIFLKQIVCGETLTVNTDEAEKPLLNLKTYPNPAQNQMWVSWEPHKNLVTEGGQMELFVTDAMGRQVLTQTVTPQNEGILIHQSTIGTGFFILHLRKNGQIIAHHKIIFN